uniref:Leucine rich repeat variant n=1 Tax=Streptomyces sp. NBC_00008 TaxID=2903610 RepID=A0AAU2W1N5_9ACTN
MNHVLCGLAANAALPSELVRRLIAVADADIAESLAGRADLSPEQAVALAARVEESAERLAYEGLLTAADIDPVTQPGAALALLDARAGDPEWARLLATDPDVRRREKLAACPGLPDEVRETLAADPDIRVVVELALWTTAEMAARLARHPHAEVRRAAAANEATPPDLLAALATGEGLPPAERCLVCDSVEVPFTHDPYCPRADCDLRSGASCDGSHESTVHETAERVLRNPAAPVAALLRFAGHPSMMLRWALAARPGLPPETGLKLADDPVPGVRAELAGNPGIDAALIRKLAADRGHDVQRTLAHNPRLPLDLLPRLSTAARIGSTLLPRVSAATPSEAEELSRSSIPAVRMLLAQRRDLPAGIRDRLAADPDTKVVKSLAPHPGLSGDQLRTMVERHGVQVMAAVAANPDAPPTLLEELSRRVPPARRALREIARHRNATGSALLVCLADSRARPLAAHHPALPPLAIVELLADDDRQVVEAAAANPSLPPAVMRELVPGAGRTPATPTARR